MTIKLGLNRMNGGHANVLADVEKRGSYVVSSMTAPIWVARGVGKCARTLKTWSAIEPATYGGPGMVPATWRLTELGVGLLAAWRERVAANKKISTNTEARI
jgi:hypothetical protein